MTRAEIVAELHQRVTEIIPLASIAWEPDLQGIYAATARAGKLISPEEAERMGQDVGFIRLRVMAYGRDYAANWHFSLHAPQVRDPDFGRQQKYTREVVAQMVGEVVRAVLWPDSPVR
jgi:hypothetical protein